MVALIIIAIIAAVLLLIMLLPVRLRIYLIYDGNGFGKRIQLNFAFIRLLPKKVKRVIDVEAREKEKEDKKPEKPKTNKINKNDIFLIVKENVGEIKELIYSVLNYCFKRFIKIKRLNTRLEIGFDDAMQTALVFGAVAGFVYNVVGVADRRLRLVSHGEDLKPDFNNPHIFAEFESILSTNIFHAVAVLGIIARHGVPIWLKSRRTVKKKGE